MHVSIKYPDAFPLKGWDKGMFGLRVTGMFKRKSVDICALDACRKQLKLEDTRETQLREDLRELHCVSFRKIPAEVLDELPSKVSEYLGVEVRRSYRVPLITTAGWLLTCLALVGLAWGAWKGLNLLESQKRERFESVALGSTIPLVPAEPSMFSPPSLGANSEPTKVLDASLTTSSPAKALRQLANAITENGKPFDVVVTVTRSAD